MTKPLYTFHEFLAAVRAVVGPGQDDAATVAAIEPLVRRIVARPDCLADLGRDANPEASFDIHTAGDLTVQCVVWKNGRVVPPHNHNGWAVIGVVSGMERNTPFRRTDDASKPWRAELQRLAPLEVAAGATCTMVPPNDIHSVDIPAGDTVAIHVYGNDLRKQWRCRFDPDTGQVTPFDPSAIGLP